MDWTQFATFLIANMAFSITLWFWSRAEARNDSRNWHSEAAADRKDLLQLIRDAQENSRQVARNILEETKTLTKNMQEETKLLATSIQEESKNFHGRLCTLEERYLQLFLNKK